MFFDCFEFIQSIPLLGKVAAIVLCSYALEDAAIILAAALASAGLLPIWLAWMAVFVGIFSGDLGVYILARFVKQKSVLRYSLVGIPTTGELIMCRFTPGLRTIAYAWCGASHMPINRFINIIFWSGLVWTISIFSLILFYGAYVAQWLGFYKWIMIPVVITLLWWHHGRATHVIHHKEHSR